MLNRKAKSKRILALDPGWNSGIAVFEDDSKCSPPVMTMLLKAASGNWKTKIILLAGKLDDILEKDPLITTLVVEVPTFWQSSDRGKIAAEKQFLTHLAVLVGAFGGVAIARGLAFVPVEVNEWKSQLSKLAVDKRIERRLGRSFPDHISDACAVGLWYLGFFYPVNELKHYEN